MGCALAGVLLLTDPKVLQASECSELLDQVPPVQFSTLSSSVMSSASSATRERFALWCGASAALVQSRLNARIACVRSVAFVALPCRCCRTPTPEVASAIALDSFSEGEDNSGPTGVRAMHNFATSEFPCLQASSSVA